MRVRIGTLRIMNVFAMAEVFSPNRMSFFEDIVKSVTC